MKVLDFLMILLVLSLMILTGIYLHTFSLVQSNNLFININYIWEK